MAPPTRATRNNSSSDMTVDQKLDLLLADIADIKNDNRKFSDDILGIKQDIKDLKTDVNESINFCSEEINNCKKKIDEQEQKLLQYENTIERLSSENQLVKKELIAVKKAERAAEQYSRSNCLEIRGVPYFEKENIMHIVKRVARALNFQLEDHMIDAVHRLSPNLNDPEVPRGIIIKFCRRIDMEMMRSKTRVKNGFSAAELGFNSESQVYVNLSLTKETMDLWKATRKFKEDKGYKYAWITSVGKVFLRQKDGARPVHITEKADLDLLK